MVKPAKKPKGVVCPRCKLLLLTVRTRHLVGGTQRVRRCRKCPYTFTSVERGPPAAG